ncbi:uroporphyrinogen-III C-methyltransferase Ecym_5481 [Eremothecium cymbalariae DBVPG|uniref:Tetrapyrrole methylase domain-containing protein n=1 Tax=Eremothecium cymbalariae (strain CBS 270.75 / DBVPG 7215 / KCTC 17166 / NRRL Y-17582) TaxID=931890 RepID=I6NDT5_ERECY|nr:hypothetical protein Ecym_5481 [Eremothecium cymbalariae DBVPG\
MTTVPLLVSLNTKEEVHLIVGSHSLNQCQARIKSILGTGAQCIVVNAKNGKDLEQLRSRFVNEPRLKLLERQFLLQDLTTLGRYKVGCVVDRVFVNLDSSKDGLLIPSIYEQCVNMRIPINTTQRPEFSTFSVLSTYVDPKGSGLQIGVTTNGKGCLLANRIKREVVFNLPSNISEGISNMGRLRDFVINQDHDQLIKTLRNDDISDVEYDVDEDTCESHKLNKLIYEFKMTEAEQKLRRSRWLSQIIEYYPLSKLANLSVNQLAGSYGAEFCGVEPSAAGVTSGVESQSTQATSHPEVSLKECPPPSIVNSSDTKNATDIKQGTISLVGSGPGSVSMLTVGALVEIKTADYILADKLVPEAILKLIPETTETFIARKFPGNAERAQEELLERGLEALQQGRKVIRLKQGDPYVFGRGGEECIFFKSHGFEPRIFPGLSSSLAATAVANIPATQRDVADQVLICTGTGRKGALPHVPEYVASRTTIFLMALHRSEVLLQALLKNNWDADIPAAIIERASCPDQRITRTLLKYVPQVIEEIGSRPPGLLVLGTAVGALAGSDPINFDNCEQKYDVQEGYHSGLPDNPLKTLIDFNLSPY